MDETPFGGEINELLGRGPIVKKAYRPPIKFPRDSGSSSVQADPSASVVDRIFAACSPP